MRSTLNCDGLTEGGPATRHKQVPIAWKGRYAEVDEELAPVILSLWKAGIDTCNSCQDNFPGIAWVEFPTMLDAKRFLDLVAVYPDERDMRAVNGRLYVGDVPFWETLYGRITGWGNDDDWRYDVNVHNGSVDEHIVNDEVVQTCFGPSDFEFFVSVRFPRTDLPLILELLQTGMAPCPDPAGIR
jgi:hypothetical protein